MEKQTKRAWTKYALVALVTAMIVAPTAAIASHGFTDVGDTYLFHSSIQWMKDNGITFGCNPPANDKYCPNDNVTRGQMAAFMQRLAQNKVVAAATAVTAQHANTADSAGTATNAENANTVDDYNAADLIPVITRLQYSGSKNSLPGGSQFAEDMVLGTFTKQSDDTVILLNWTDSAETIGYVCHYQIRVDGVTDNGNATTTAMATDGGNAVLWSSSQISVVALFRGLAAGDHEIEIYLRGNAGGCSLNPSYERFYGDEGIFGQTVIITEMLATAG